MKQKKSQSALEFLITYGWAFLVILIMIAAMAYFDVFNIGNRIPGSCTFTQGLLCSELRIDSDASAYTINQNIITFVVVNQATGGTISTFNITDVTIQGSDCEIDASENELNQSSWRQGERRRFTVSCGGSSEILSGERPNLDFTGEFRLSGRQLYTSFTGRISDIGMYS